MREEARGVAGGTEVEAFDALDSGAAQHALRDRPEVEVSTADSVGAEALAIRAGDVLADLVATRPDARTDHCCEPPAERGNARVDDALQQPKPSNMQEGERRLLPVLARKRDRETVGRQLQHRDTGLIGPEPVALATALAGFGAVDGGGVYLAVHRQPRDLRAGRLAEPAPVFLDLRGLVVSQEAEVERVEGAFADATEARRKGDRIRARRVPGKKRDAHGSCARARSSNWSRVFSSGSSTTASRSASRAAPSSGPSP